MRKGTLSFFDCVWIQALECRLGADASGDITELVPEYALMGYSYYRVDINQHNTIFSPLSFSNNQIPIAENHTAIYQLRF